MGGTVQSEGWGTAAIRVLGRGKDDAIVTVAAGATAISLKDAGVLAWLSDHAREGAADNQVKIEMGGAILGRSGVSAQVRFDASYETYEGSGETIAARAATAPPVIDIAWTGSFGAGTTAQTAPNDDDRFFAASLLGALGQFRRVEIEKASGGVYGGAAGIEAQVMDWRLELMPEVAKGDDPGEIADATAQENLLSTTHADSRRDAILAQVRAALGSAELDAQTAAFTPIDAGATGLDDLSDDEIVAYLSADNAGRRTLLRNVLASSLSDAEKAVVRALAMGDAPWAGTASEKEATPTRFRSRSTRRTCTASAPATICLWSSTTKASRIPSPTTRRRRTQGWTTVVTGGNLGTMANVLSLSLRRWSCRPATAPAPAPAPTSPSLATRRMTAAAAYTRPCPRRCWR